MSRYSVDVASNVNHLLMPILELKGISGKTMVSVYMRGDYSIYVKYLPACLRCLMKVVLCEYWLSVHGCTSELKTEVLR